MPELDAQWTKKIKQHQDKNEVLCFVGSIDNNGKAKVGLRPYSHQHAFAHLRGSDNIILFQTKRYNDHPLIIQGPGAGAHVTAGGVFADILRLAELIRAAP